MVLTSLAFSEEEGRWSSLKKHSELFHLVEESVEPDSVAVKNSWLNSGEFLDSLQESRLQLTMRGYLSVIQQRNEKVLFQLLEKQIVAESENNARSIYDPTVSFSLERKSIRELNASEEALARSSLIDYINKTNTLTAGITGLVPSGAQLNLDYTFEDIVSNLQTPSLSGSELRTAIGVSLTQPLLKNFGSKVTRANIAIAEEERGIAEQTYRNTLMQAAFNGIQAYLDLQLAQEKLKANRDSVRVAEKMLQDNQKQFNLGQMAETEVLEAQAGLA